MEVVLQPQRWPLSGGGYQDSLNGRRQLKRFASQPCSVQSVRRREGSSLSRSIRKGATVLWRRGFDPSSIWRCASPLR